MKTIHNFQCFMQHTHTTRFKTMQHNRLSTFTTMNLKEEKSKIQQTTNNNNKKTNNHFFAIILNEM